MTSSASSSSSSSEPNSGSDSDSSSSSDSDSDSDSMTSAFFLGAARFLGAAAAGFLSSTCANCDRGR